MTSRIFMSSPDVGPEEEAALLRGFRSGWIAPLGPEVDAFEAELASVAGRRHAVALSSGTAALHLGLLNLGVRPGDVVMTASMTFAATANAITYTGARPAFVDADETGSMSADLLESGIEDQLARGNTVSAIVPVDLLGKVVDHAAIRKVAERHNVPVLSDAAESLGALRDGSPSASFGDVAVLSFNGNKIMTTSGGGALLTDDGQIASRTRYLATQARQPVVHYEHTDIGYNYRLSNLLAALGRAQLTRLESMIDRRRQWRNAYREMVTNIPGVEIFGGADGSDIPNMTGTRDNFWLTSIVIDPAIAGTTRTAVMEALAREDIESRPLWKPMHLQPVYADHNAYVNGISQRLFEQGLSLPSGSALTDQEFERVLSALRAALQPVD